MAARVAVEPSTKESLRLAAGERDIEKQLATVAEEHAVDLAADARRRRAFSVDHDLQHERHTLAAAEARIVDAGAGRAEASVDVADERQAHEAPETERGTDLDLEPLQEGHEAVRRWTRGPGRSGL